MRILGGLAVPRTAFKHSVYMKNNQKPQEQKAGCQAANNSYEWTIPCQADTHTHTSTNWQPLIKGNPNYNGFQCLLKLLIITANNYSMPSPPWEGGGGNYTPSQSVTCSYSQSVNQPASLTVLQSHHKFYQHSALKSVRKCGKLQQG